jgi:putative membrane protein
MATLTLVAIGVVAVLHIVFFVLESILWTKPFGRKTFGLTKERAADTAGLALNQGLYNLFLAAGLIWGIVATDCAFQIRLFFLACVVIAGIVGAISVKRSILFIQGVPAILALLLLLLTHR